jgi:hypothetical protein
MRIGDMIVQATVQLAISISQVDVFAQISNVTIGGTLNGAQFAAGASGAISGALTVAMAIGGCIEGYKDIMQASMSKIVDKVMGRGASSATAGSGNMPVFQSSFSPTYLSQDVLAGFTAATSDYMVIDLTNFRETTDYSDARSYNLGLEIADKLFLNLGASMTALGVTELGAAASMYLAGASAELASAGAATPVVIIDWVGATAIAADGIMNVVFGSAISLMAANNMANRDGYGEEGTYRKNNKEHKKKDHLKGGSQKSRDGDKLESEGGEELVRWFHREWKQKRPPGPRRTPDDEINEAIEFWKELKRKLNG